MADTLLTDLHVRYIQNLGKVSFSIHFKPDDNLNGVDDGLFSIRMI